MGGGALEHKSSAGSAQLQIGLGHDHTERRSLTLTVHSVRTPPPQIGRNLLHTFKLPRPGSHACMGEGRKGSEKVPRNNKTEVH